MLTLCSDTSGSVMSFTLVEMVNDTARWLNSYSISSENMVGELFFPNIKQFFASTSAKLGRRLVPQDIDEWVSIVGPGSFTGIRIGIAATAGIALGLGKKHLGVSSLDAAAIVSGLERLALAVRIRFGEYAVRSYDFTNNIFSDVYISKESALEKDVLIIGTRDSQLSCITEAIMHGHWTSFACEPVAYYVKRHEAEESLAQTSNI
ncbi:hypothetical protein RsTz2092_11500 [Deferribacterales bacterium RsTz2092]|nr:hypothetical protein AGMMS49941_10650 [Deferribacterales bacterium]